MQLFERMKNKTMIKNQSNFESRNSLMDSNAYLNNVMVELDKILSKTKSGFKLEKQNKGYLKASNYF